MNKLIKDKLLEIMKQVTKPDEVIAKLREDAQVKVLELKDEDFDEIRSSVELATGLQTLPTPAPASAPTSTSAPAPAGTAVDVVAQLAELRKANNDLLEKVKGHERSIKKRDMIAWLRKEAPFSAGDIEKTSDNLLKLEEADADAAKLMKESLQRTSRVLAMSPAFEDLGSSREGSLSSVVGNEYFQKIAVGKLEVQKSETLTPKREIEIIKAAVKSLGPDAYSRYREEHIQNARLGGRASELFQT